MSTSIEFFDRAKLAKLTILQGVSGLDGFFEFDISDTYNAATVL